MERFQKKLILRDLQKKMVLLAGPRQAGKTTLSHAIAKEFASPLYLNFDSLEDRKMMEKEAWSDKSDLLIFDEIHKMSKWKNYLKGVYDTKKEHQKILVTGSARLEIFHQVGDSLAGRYFLHRLLPLSPAECAKQGVQYSLDHFIERSGFPEPFFAPDELDAKRWRNQYSQSLLREDVLDFENIQNVKAIQLLFKLLQERVGSPISFSSLARDIAISPNSVKRYIEIFEALYIIFRVTPYSKNIARSILKEPKIYFFDTGLVKGDEGIQFENLVANALLKDVHYKIDYLAQDASLQYISTKEKKEVDFALVNDKTIEKLIEVKLSSSTVSSNLHYFHKKYDLPAMQLVKNLKHSKKEGLIEVCDARDYLQSLDI